MKSERLDWPRSRAPNGRSAGAPSGWHGRPRCATMQARASRRVGLFLLVPSGRPEHRGGDDRNQAGDPVDASRRGEFHRRRVGYGEETSGWESLFNEIGNFGGETLLDELAAGTAWCTCRRTGTGRCARRAERSCCCVPCQRTALGHKRPQTLARPERCSRRAACSGPSREPSGRLVGAPPARGRARAAAHGRRCGR
jgi:hypothetical protein